MRCASFKLCCGDSRTSGLRMGERHGWANDLLTLRSVDGCFGTRRLSSSGSSQFHSMLMNEIK